MCDLFGAYFDARRNKRHTINALSFEVDYETKLFGLYEDIKNGEYCINPSVCFISFSPVQREIFAADFRDRIVHHLIYNYISPLFERLFIGDSYSCRVGKGTSRGVERLGHFIRSCSHNYQKDCYVLKLDIMGYFMAIDHFVLYQKVERVINRFRYDVYFDVDLVLRLIRQVIFHDHVKNCRIKGKIKDWSGLPKSKSLFWAEKNKGLPIGNLTSQLFGNVYLNDFDHFVKRTFVSDTLVSGALPSDFDKRATDAWSRYSVVATPIDSAGYAPPTLTRSLKGNFDVTGMSMSWILPYPRSAG